jgi:NAD-dependent SIR2 family protein deacetylase
MDLTEKYLGEAKGSSTKMECMECGHKFRKRLGRNTIEVKCPKCKGYDTEPAMYEEFGFIDEADFIGTIDLDKEGRKNVDMALKIISSMEDWLNMTRAMIINGKKNDSIKIVDAIDKRSNMLKAIVKKIPNRKVTNLRAVRTKMV